MSSVVSTGSAVPPAAGSPMPAGVPTFGRQYENSSPADRVREIAIAAPERIAIVCDGRQVTYGDLAGRASALGRSVARQLGAGSEPVATMFGHDEGGIVAFLAASWAGRPFAQLDPQAPVERLGAMLATSGAAVLLTDAAHFSAAQAVSAAAGRGPAGVGDRGSAGAAESTSRVGGPRGAGCSVLLVDEVEGASEGSVQPARPATPARASAATAAVLPAVPPGDPGDPLAIFFTSGSTGTPKGVIRSRRMVMCDTWSGVAALGFEAADRAAVLLPYSFAAGFEVVLWTLSTGAALYLFDPRVAGVPALVSWLAEQRPTTIHTTPSALARMLAEMAPDHMLDHARLVTTCTEPIHGREIAALRDHLDPDGVFVNWLGASEIGCLAFNRFDRATPPPDGAISAGWAVPDRPVQIWDDAGTPVGPDQTGEVVVVSDYLATGYVDEPGRTAEKFGVTPDGRRFYRTGDLGRLAGDGQLTLVGRADAALKIRGYLVEPVEIETVLLELPAIRAAVVTGRPGASGEPRLCAYVELASGADTTIAELRRHLRSRLPAYMVPAGIQLLATLPRNDRGKVDRQALPDIPERPGTKWVGARNPQEDQLLEIWRLVLGLDGEAIGVTDDFIELGGDSLTAQALIAQINDQLRVELTSAALAEAPTIEALAELIGRERFGASRATCIQLHGSAEAADSTVFCFAGGGGTALNFLNLARRIGAGRNIVGFQPRGLEARQVPDWSVSQHARRHLADIRRIQPRGPYHLVGFSFGGLVAYEVAQRLTAAGEQVALLALLDPDLPFLASGRLPSTTWAAGVPAAAPTGVSGAGGGAGLQEVWDAWSRSLPEPLAKGADLSRRAAMTAGRIAEVALTGLVPSHGSNYHRFYRQSKVLTVLYPIRPYFGRTVLFVAEEDTRASATGWRKVLRGDLTIRAVGGMHSAMLREPNVAILAAALEEELAAAKLISE